MLKDLIAEIEGNEGSAAEPIMFFWCTEVSMKNCKTNLPIAKSNKLDQTVCFG